MPDQSLLDAANAEVRSLQSQLSSITAQRDEAIALVDEYRIVINATIEARENVMAERDAALKEVKELKTQIRTAYFDGFNQAHYSHLHPDGCPPKECEVAADEYFANKSKKEETKP